MTVGALLVVAVVCVVHVSTAYQELTRRNLQQYVCHQEDTQLI